MKRSKALKMGTVFAAAALAGPLWGDVKPNPYESIVERNPFQLKDPPPPPPPPDPTANQPPAALATVEVTGITSMFSTPKVLLEIVPGPGKPPIKPILSAGERVESIEVVSIDVEKGEVTIKNGNLTTNVPLRVAKAGGPAAPAAPAAGGAIPIRPQVPMAVPTASPAGASYGGQSAYGSGRGSIVLSGGSPSAPAAVNPSIGYGGTAPASFGAAGGAATLGNPTVPGATAVGTVDNSLRSIPSRTIRSSGPGTTFQNPAAKPLTGEEQYILMKAHEMDAQQRRVPFPPLPSPPPSLRGVVDQ
jgi:hypothetical protein